METLTELVREVFVYIITVGIFCILTVFSILFLNSVFNALVF
jgi:hypothetical protein